MQNFGGVGLEPQATQLNRAVDMVFATTASPHDHTRPRQYRSVSNGIRQNVMDMRMLPIGPLFNRFHRGMASANRKSHDRHVHRPD